MADYFGQTVDVHEDFEDASLASGLSETDTDGRLTINSGTQYKNGSAAMAVDATTQTNPAYIGYTTDVGSVSVGFWFRGPTLSDWEYLPALFTMLRGGFADMSYIEYKYSGSQPTLKFWVGANSTSINVSAATWYWVTGQLNRNATSYWRVYNTSQAQVGSTVSHTAEDYNVDRLRIGATDVHAVSGIGYFDDYVFDVTDATYPLYGWATATDPITWTPHVGKVMVFG